VSLLLITAAVFVGVTALVGGVMLLLGQKPGSRIEDRLDLLTGVNTPAAAKEGLLKQASVLTRPLDQGPGLLDALVERFSNFNLQLLFEQADTSLTATQLMVASAGLAAAGGALALFLKAPLPMVPLAGILLGAVPAGWVLFRRRKRLKLFAAQLPDALEMLARALRAGQSLAFGFNMVGSEMGAPIGKEFSRIFEEQNLGIPMEESLSSFSQRIPNLDLKFFITAVLLQRQTGGDLAEILDNIGNLIRDRFRIWGQVQALTGEGRLSGIVLMALPLALFLAVYHFNEKYISLLFTDPLGKKMLAFAIIMQVVGALVIRKIVNIKV
jgi:tight adherence protein B